MTTVNPIKANPRPEEAWHGADLRRLGALHAQLLDAGYSPAFVNGLVGWLVASDAELVTKPTAAAYRKALRELEPPRRSTPRGRRRGSERGFVDAGRLALAGSGATVGAASASFAALSGPLSVLCVVAPIILGESDSDASAGHRGAQVVALHRVEEVRPHFELARAS